MKINMELIKTLVQGDKINVSFLNCDNEIITKKCTFHSIDGNFILVKPPKAKRKAWEIPINSETKIEKL